MDQKQLFQIQNILETILEATDHFAELIKEKNFNQSVFIFTSIVEGCESTFPLLNQIHTPIEKETKTIENILLLTAKEFNDANFIKVAEIVQFSLRPSFKKLINSFVEQIGDQKKEKTIKIGVFHSWANPKEIMRPGRIEAMNSEAEKQNAKLYYFTSENVDFTAKTIEADTYDNDDWKRVTIPFPDVINNIGAGKRSIVERKLRREIPFTSFYVGNKYTLPKRMAKFKKYTELIIPFTVCFTEEVINKFMNNNERVVFKDLSRNRGENIYFVTRTNNRYILLDQHKERILNEDEFQNFIKHTILAEKGSYIIQRYIHARTKNDEPYHIRAQVQKSSEGQWVITLIYCTIGPKGTSLSNLNVGGRNENLDYLLASEFGKSKGIAYEEKLNKLVLGLAKHLDHIYNYSLEELGIDLAIDDQGKIWMYEANNGPVTRFYEHERAVHTIAYAKYIAKNGIMYTDLSAKKAAIKGHFQATNASLPRAPHTNNLRIGLLVGKVTQNNLVNSLHAEATKNDEQFFYFTPKDIDYDLNLIRGYFYKDNEWVPKVTEYPDVIIDQIKMRGHENSGYLYEELAEVVFLNNFPIHSVNRLDILNQINRTHRIAKYQHVKRTRDIFRFLEIFGRVFLYSQKLSSIKPIYQIKSLDGGIYQVISQKETKQYSELNLRHHLNHLMEDNQLIVQQDSRINDSKQNAFSIEFHLVKNNNHWVSIDSKVNISLKENFEQKRIPIQEFLDSDLNIFTHKDDALNQLVETSQEVAQSFDEQATYHVNELYLSLSVNTNLDVEILDINPAGTHLEENLDLFSKVTLDHARGLLQRSKL